MTKIYNYSRILLGKLKNTGFWYNNILMDINIQPLEDVYNFADI